MVRVFFRGCGVFVLVAGTLLSAQARANPDLSFEADMPGDAPAGWTIKAADAVVVTGEEGPHDFYIYDWWSKHVQPFDGEHMLRLGSPRKQHEHQPKGVNSIRQRFAAHDATLTFALRVFSFEHRGNDKVIIDLRDPASSLGFVVEGEDGKAFELDMPRGADPSCASTPCRLAIDVGKSQDKLDSGWQTITLSGLPTDGRDLVLSIRLKTTQNGAHPTWLYVDGIEAPPEPPVARMNWNPGFKPNTVAQEADYVVFDCLDSTTKSGKPLTCTWTASGAGLPVTSAQGETAVFVFPDEGTATVTLEVSDGELTDSTTTGDHKTPPLVIDNAIPLVNALNVEVLTGDAAELVCRFADPGVEDTHSVSFSISAPLGQQIFMQENIAALSSGFARVEIDASQLEPDVYSGLCTVTDNDGGSASDTFTLSVLSADAFADEVAANTGSTVNATIKTADASYIGGIPTPDSIAVYELRLPDGEPFPVGAEVNVEVTVPVDFDIAVLNGFTDSETEVAPWVSAPWVSAPWVSAPWVNVPFVSVPFVSVPWVSVPFVSAPWVSAPWVSAPWVNAPVETSPWVSAGYTYQDLPLSQVGLAAPSGDQVSGVDIAFDDLGTLAAGDLANESVRVKALSAELGTRREHLLVKVGPGEQGLFLAVIPQSGSFSTAPFSMQIEASVPPSQEQLQGAACEGAPLVDAGTSAVSVLVDHPAPTSLIVTQRERMMATHGLDSAGFDSWLASLMPFFTHANVAARVVSVPSQWFDDADTAPCSVAEQNLVATQIRSLIQQHLLEAEQAGTPIEYVQLMGGLDIIPPYYSPDETQTGYEGLYSPDLLVRPNTPLSVAIAQGNNLTDAYYVDRAFQPFRGRSLYTEDVSVSRMVETPAEIAANAARFVAADGIINLTSSQSTGYDFFIDGTERVNQILAALPAPTRTRNDNTWTAEDLRCQFFGQGEGCTVSELNAVNAHMSYNGGISASGFFSNDPDEIFAAQESAGILNGVTFSIGCHSGLSVPDAWALPDNTGLPLDPAADWVQQLGTWVGAYTYAYGDSEVADRGTEGIMPLVIANFARGDTLGNALIKAKWEYGTGLYEFGVYDEKSLIALNLFGMPQARLGALATSVPEPQGNAIGDTSETVGQTLITVLEQGATVEESLTLERQSNALGSWFTLEGNAQGVVGRALQPVAKPFESRLVPAGGTTAHGVALLGGVYTEYLDQDPVLPVQQHDWVQSFEEPTACVNTMSPTQIAALTRFDSPQGTLQSLIVQPGQFECTLAPEERGLLPVRGTFRIWDSTNLEVLHPLLPEQDADLEPPVVTQQDLAVDAEAGTVTATLNAEDNLGLREIIALVYQDLDGVPGGQGTVTSYSTGDIQSAAGPYVLELPDAAGARLAFQYIDVAGNVLTKTAKGALLRGVEVLITTGVFTTQGVTTISVEAEDFSSLATPFLTLDFGDGSAPQVLELVNRDGSYIDAVTVNAEDVATVSVAHSYQGFTGSSVTVTADLRAAGAQGRDEATLFACSDPAGDGLIPDGDITTCGISFDSERISIDMSIAGGLQNELKYQVYLVDLDLYVQYYLGTLYDAPSWLGARVDVLGANSLRFSFDAEAAGYSGSGVFDFSQSVLQFDDNGTPTTLDQTQVFSLQP